ncbi:MAG TPA: S53 family peptidase [Jatrophihabitantaceae bacterium]|jgi:kumamolisin|nr:S53 family peptidase [Jatrophihabitantaceae bacterium]
MPENSLPGSERFAAPDATSHGPVDPSASVELTIVLRRRADGELGADPDDLRTVSAALENAGLHILLADAPSRRIRVSGPASLVSSVFGATLESVTSRAPDGRAVTHRQRTGELSLPAELGDRVLAVLGLDDRPQARSQFRIANAADVSTSYTPVQVGDAYAFPPGTDGTGQAVAIIELGGGFAQGDLDTYFSGLGIASPTVTAIGVDGASNQAGSDPQGADGEVLLDIEVIGALTPGAAINVYFAPNTDAGFLDAVSEAVHADPTPAAISISWGQSEDDWTAQARTAMDSVFADAVQLGIVVTAAAGDNGSTDGATDGSDHCDFPASSPNVLGCGGTSLSGTGETVWNNGAGNGATGGGVSDVFDRPARQAGAGVPGTGRGVPDVAGNADPQTGYQVLVDGSSQVIGGTSAVAPLWAALVARLAQATGGPLTGFADLLYQGVSAGSSPSGFHDVTSGDNGSFAAGPGWDACTGLGSPDGTALLDRLQQT